ncbi:MAG: hypothetical protein ABIS51_03795 [Sphingomonas sp.]
MEARRLKSVRSDWSNTLLVCRKCSKRLDGGFGPKGRTSLAKALRKHLDVKKGRKARLGIVEVKCLGVCPRGAVTVINGKAPDEWALVKAGADLDAVAFSLGLPEVR